MNNGIRRLSIFYFIIFLFYFPVHHIVKSVWSCEITGTWLVCEITGTWLVCEITGTWLVWPGAVLESPYQHEHSLLAFFVLFEYQSVCQCNVLLVYSSVFVFVSDSAPFGSTIWNTVSLDDRYIPRLDATPLECDPRVCRTYLHFYVNMPTLTELETYNASCKTLRFPLVYTQSLNPWYFCQMAAILYIFTHKYAIFAQIPSQEIIKYYNYGTTPSNQQKSNRKGTPAPK